MFPAINLEQKKIITISFSEIPWCVTQKFTNRFETKKRISWTVSIRCFQCFRLPIVLSVTQDWLVLLSFNPAPLLFLIQRVRRPSQTVQHTIQLLEIKRFNCRIATAVRVSISDRFKVSLDIHIYLKMKATVRGLVVSKWMLERVLNPHEDAPLRFDQQPYRSDCYLIIKRW